MTSYANLLYVISHGPYSNAQGQEALDAILIGASFEQSISVLFVHDGVFQLKFGQSTAESGIKQYTKTFKALSDFDVEHCYVHDLSLLARGLTQDDLMIDTTLQTSAQVADLITNQSKVFTF